MKKILKYKKNGYIKLRIILNRIVIMVLLFVLVFSDYRLAMADGNDEFYEGQLYSKAIALIDAKSGRLLYGKNENLTLPMASTTKILTCIIALENADINGVLEVSENACKMPRVKLDMREGEKYVLKDLLYSLMLESHNDSAVAIAEYVSGDVKKFANKMNEKAEEIGCEKSYFITPNGLDAKEVDEKTKTEKVHSTTAYELAKIMAYCIEESKMKEEFLEITRTSSYSFCDVDGKRKFTCNNHNAFLNMMDGALTGKTGFTNDAGYCYVGALEKDDRTFIVALLASGWPNNKSYKWKDTLKLMNYAIENYKYIEIEKTEIEEIEIENAISDDNTEKNPYLKTYLKFEEVGENKRKVLLKKNEEISRKVELKDIELPIKKGDNMGKVTYSIENGTEVLFENEVVVKNSIKKVEYNIYLDFIIEKFLL